MWSLWLGGAAFLVWLYSRRNLAMSAVRLFEVYRSLPKEPVEALHVAGNVYSVEYIHEGRKHRLFFPLREEVKSYYRGKDVYINIGQTTVNISQQAGVPYLIRSGDFDKDAYITIVSEDDYYETLGGEESLPPYL